ncbi:BZ3500_MvSof-1268-A1-R1_Chr6-3g08684 [Microbotryum saponariae]|uniref:BZ3500_MvSof-1268-A1-R1_Chr6-3g08684 protein n=1 Tax=Microbotryum saponariae TaxID=289078 RepID=A0A2X0KIM7_9BASI|nr:BZ3500_MvSof-1268-A1-R1_Chr6-3g08684 [Microbotryum saponariae]SDA07285.1 BZ3501_MvSof-1269-A2-R1_Chr6-2g08387 [Microbotryum saponariae]
MPEDSLGAHRAAEETETSVGEVIIPFRTVLGLELIGCWRKMRCHFTGFFLFGFGMQRWTSVKHLFRTRSTLTGFDMCCGKLVKGQRSRGTCGIGKLARAWRGAGWRQMAVWSSINAA